MVSAQMPLELELEADLEHQEDETDLGQAREDGGGRGGKQGVHEVREERSEQARPQEHAGEDLTGHIGLAEPAHDRGHEPCREEDHDELVEQPECDLLRAAPDGGVRAGRGARDLGADRRAEHYRAGVTPPLGCCRAGRSCPRGSSACSCQRAGA